jgi:aminoglycoside phosphotransferase (APT) family kinase protein
VNLSVPTPEIELGREDVARLIGSQFPELDVAGARLLANGWDNAAWLIDGSWVFRFPLHAGAATLLRRELSVLPRLAPRLSLSTPVPTFIGHPSGAYPWPFFGAPWIPGRELPIANVPDEGRVGIARRLGAFLRQLHDPELVGEFASELRRRPERSDVNHSLSTHLERLEAVRDAGWSVPPRVHELISAAAQLPPVGELVVVHGDLHVRHLVVSDQAELAGVIDWGDVSIAHPSVDLQIGWSGFAGQAREAFLTAYGKVPEDWALRAQVSAIFYSATLALYARRDGLRELAREAIAGLERASMSGV